MNLYFIIYLIIPTTEIFSKLNQTPSEDSTYLLIATGFFILSALGIIFNPAVYSFKTKIKNDLDSIRDQITEMSDKVSDLATDVINHNIYIKHFVSEKEIISSLEHIMDVGLSYVDEDKDIYVYINEVSRMFVSIVNEVLDVGIDELNPRILRNKLLTFNKFIFNDKKHLVDEEFVRDLKQIRIKNKNKNKQYIENTMEVVDDVINSKIDRYRVISEGYLHELLRDIFLIYNKHNNHEQK